MQIGGMGAMPNPAMMQQGMMSRFDTDTSGGINLQEFSSMRDTVSARHPNASIASGSAEDVFAKIDADSSGELTSGEMRAFRKANMPSTGGMLGSDVMKSLLHCQNVGEGGGCHNGDEGGDVRGPRLHRAQRMMSRFDGDESGTLNLREFSSMHEAISSRRPDAPIASRSAEDVFAKIDADGNGELTLRELKAFRMANKPSEVDGPRHRLMSRFDNDHNGTLNLREFSSMHEAISSRRPDAPIASRSAEDVFAKIDADGNGELTSRELRAFRMANKPSEGNVGGPPRPIAWGNIEELFNLIDADASGELSLSEFEAFKLANEQTEAVR